MTWSDVREKVYKHLDPSTLFAPLKTEEEALTAVRNCGVFFIGMGLFMGALWFALSFVPDAKIRAMTSDAFYTAGVFILLGALLYWLKSRIVAILLVVVSLAAVAATLAAMLGVAEGGQNIALALLVLGSSFRSTQATFRLHRIRRDGRGHLSVERRRVGPAIGKWWRSANVGRLGFVLALAAPLAATLAGEESLRHPNGEFDGSLRESLALVLMLLAPLLLLMAIGINAFALWKKRGSQALAGAGMVLSCLLVALLVVVFFNDVPSGITSELGGRRPGFERPQP